MQPNQRIVSCSKQVRMDGQALLVNQAMPLAGGAPEKGSSQRNCRQPADCESKSVALTKAPDGQVDRETAGKQTNGIKNRCVKNFFRRRSRQTLSQIEEVRYNEDREDRGLCRDQAEHPDTCAVGKLPWGGRVVNHLVRSIRHRLSRCYWLDGQDLFAGSTERKNRTISLAS